MAEVISLVDRLKEKNGSIEYAQGRFPLFEGKVLSVSGKVMAEGETFSIIDYMPKDEEAPEPNMVDVLVSERREKLESQLSEKVKRVLVPFSVEPEVVNGSDVRGYIDEVEGHHFYTLEVLKDESLCPGVDLAKLLGPSIGLLPTNKYGGFKYMVQI